MAGTAAVVEGFQKEEIGRFLVGFSQGRGVISSVY
jgi:hypothetical protein